MSGRVRLLKNSLVVVSPPFLTNATIRPKIWFIASFTKLQQQQLPTFIKLARLNVVTYVIPLGLQLRCY